MTVLQSIAFYQNRRDEAPNQELAHRLFESQDRQGIQEIAEGLWHHDPNVQSDCLKVLYEIGYLQPVLVAEYTADFMELLQSRNNHLVWGAMTALSTVAALQADELFPHTVEIQKAMDSGSVITRDNGVKVLAAIAATKVEYRLAIFPYLLSHLQTCRPKDVPQHAESILPAVDASNRDVYIQVLENRKQDLNVTQAARVNKVITGLRR